MNRPSDTRNAQCADHHPPTAENPAAHSMHVPKGGSGWTLLLQHGVRVDCVTGLPLADLLRELDLSEEQISRVDVLLLDGKPVDSPRTAIVPCGARLALAAGLPGIAGLAMKSNSAVRGLRPGITHLEQDTGSAPPVPGPGHIELALFSLALPLLAAHFLQRGVTLACADLLRFLRPALADPCLFDDEPLSPEQVRQKLAGLAPDTLIFFSAQVSV